MAYTIDQIRGLPVTGSGVANLDQWVHVKRASQLLPATTTQQIFRVYGGKVLVRKLFGTVTVVLDSTDPVIKVSHQALSQAGVLIGTAVDIASTVDINSLEVGGHVFVEGDGTAIVKSNAGCVLGAANQGNWIAPVGDTYITTGGTNATGFMEWDMFYTPLDEGAFVVSVDTVTAKV